MGTRLDFHAKLIDLTNGGNVYFQPPPNIQIVYPAIVYNRDFLDVDYADNAPYYRMFRWQVTVIDRDPDNPVLEKLADLPLTAFVRHFTTDNLNHDVYDVYF